jgi:hypothetical protein
MSTHGFTTEQIKAWAKPDKQAKLFGVLQQPTILDQDSPYYCSPGWHFAALTGRGAIYVPLIYAHALLLAGKSRRYCPSIENLAKYFRTSVKSIRRAVHLLVATGFFEELKAEPGRPVSYDPILHTRTNPEWPTKHPGQCCVRIEMPDYWRADGDPLAVQLHAATDQKVRFYANMLKALRNVEPNDSAILAHCQEFWQNGDTGPAGQARSHKGFFGRFYKDIKAKKENEATY